RRRLPDSSLLIPPTVSEELAWLADNAEGIAERKAARRFLAQHRSWSFQLLHTVPLGNLYVAGIAERLLQAALLPAAEANDAQILAEAATLGCSVLLSSDEHLRAIDFQRLSFELTPFELVAPGDRHSARNCTQVFPIAMCAHLRVVVAVFAISLKQSILGYGHFSGDRGLRGIDRSSDRLEHSFALDWSRRS